MNRNQKIMVFQKFRHKLSDKVEKMIFSGQYFVAPKLMEIDLSNNSESMRGKGLLNNYALKWIIKTTSLRPFGAQDLTVLYHKNRNSAGFFTLLTTLIPYNGTKLFLGLTLGKIMISSIITHFWKKFKKLIFDPF